MSLTTSGAGDPQFPGIGVIVPYDMALDRELWRWTPDDVSLYFTRTPFAPLPVGVAMAAVVGDDAQVTASVRDLSAVSPQVYAYACTSGSFVRGRAGEQSLVDAMQTAGAPEAVTTSGALLEALQHLDVRRIGIATPYDEGLTSLFRDFLVAAGDLDVVGSSQLGLDAGVWKVPQERVEQLVRQADHDAADAIVVSCTNLPTYDVIASLEAQLGKPVVTANQATIWSALRRIGRTAVGPRQILLEPDPGRPVPPLTAITTKGTVSNIRIPAPQPPSASGRIRAPESEFIERLARVQAAMAERSLAALVVADPANLFYLSGYDAWSFYTPQCLIVPAEGEPHLFARAMDAAGAGLTCNLPRERVHGYPETLVHRPDCHPYDWITARGRELGLLPAPGDATVAFEGDSAFFTARGYLALAAGLDGVRLIDSGELVNWVRLIKSSYELGQLRIAGTIAERVMRLALDAVGIGRRHCDAVAEIMRAQAMGTPENGGDYPAIVPMLPTGDSSGTPHLTWTDAVFETGEASTIELAGAYNRYHAPLARTVMLGQPPHRLMAAADVLAEAMPLTLAALVPGATGSEVHGAFDVFLRRHGMTKESRIGYSIGVGYPPDWGERTVSLRAEEKTVIQPGMAFHVILGMWMDGWGYEVSEPVVVTEAGAERLCQVPEILTIKR